MFVRGALYFATIGDVSMPLGAASLPVGDFGNG